MAQRILIPPLHANTSDLYQQSYRSTFRGDESFCTAQGTLRETASLELARAAVEQAMRSQAAESIELRDVEWLSAVPASPAHPVSIMVDALDAGGVGYEIYSASPDGERVHGRGEAVLLDEPTRMRLDLAQLQSRMRVESDAQRYRGDGELLARWNCRRRSAAVRKADGLHPALLDAALRRGARAWSVAMRSRCRCRRWACSLRCRYRAGRGCVLRRRVWMWICAMSRARSAHRCAAGRSAHGVAERCLVAMSRAEPAFAEASQAEAPAPRMAPLRIALQTRVDATAPSAPAVEIEVVRHKPTGVALIDPVLPSSPSQWSVSSKAKPRFGLMCVSFGARLAPAHGAAECTARRRRAKWKCWIRATVWCRSGSRRRRTSCRPSWWRRCCVRSRRCAPRHRRGWWC